MTNTNLRKGETKKEKKKKKEVVGDMQLPKTLHISPHVE
jgi:hypothetical protein